MQIEVVAFAALREAFGSPRVSVDLAPGATVGDLREHLASVNPPLGDLIRSCRLARGVDFVGDELTLDDGMEVILIPPVSGGNLETNPPGPPTVLLTQGLLDVERLKEAARRDEAGALTVFEGTVRSPSEGKEVHYLEYEAYEAMAVAQMERIVAESAERWPISATYLHHRLGRVEVGEASVVIVVSSPHRDEAFAACRFVIEQLKADVPIWKKEYLTDGSVWVGAPGECRPAESETT